MVVTPQRQGSRAFGSTIPSPNSANRTTGGSRRRTNTTVSSSPKTIGQENATRSSSNGKKSSSLRVSGPPPRRTASPRLHGSSAGGDRGSTVRSTTGSERPTTVRRSASPGHHVKQYSSKTLTSRRTINLSQAGLRESEYDNEEDEAHHEQQGATSSGEHCNLASPTPGFQDPNSQWDSHISPLPSQAQGSSSSFHHQGGSNEHGTEDPHSASPEISTTNCFAAGGGRASRRSMLLIPDFRDDDEENQNPHSTEKGGAHCAKKSGSSSSRFSPAPLGGNGRSSTTMTGFSADGTRKSYAGRHSTGGGRFTLSNLPSINIEHFDPMSTANWLGQVLAHLDKKVPSDIEKYEDDNRGIAPAPPPVASFDADPEQQEIKLSFELFKRLFQAHQGFAELDDQNGLLLVASAFEDILKIRPKLRDGRCVCVPTHIKHLLDKFYPELITSLAPKYPALESQVEARNHRLIPGLELSDSFLSMVTKWKQTSTLLDVLNAPCDVTTFGAVVGHGDLQLVSVAKAVVHEEVVEAVCEQMLDAEECGDWGRLGDLWRLLEEALYVCVEAFESSRVDSSFNDCVFMDILLRNKLLGRICRAAHSNNNLNNSAYAHEGHVAQRCAVNTLEMLAQRNKSRNVLVRLLRDFPDALSYLLPCLYEEDVGVQAQCCQGLLSLLDENRRVLYPILFTFQEYFKQGVQEAVDPTALLRLVQELIVPNYYKLDNEGRDYVFFHREMIIETVNTLHSMTGGGGGLNSSTTSISRKNSSTSKRRSVAMVQYLTHLLTTNPIEDFVDLALQLRLPEYVTGQLEANSRLASTRGGLTWGTYNKLFNALKAAIDKCAQSSSGMTPVGRTPGSASRPTQRGRGTF